MATIQSLARAAPLTSSPGKPQITAKTTESGALDRGEYTEALICSFALMSLAISTQLLFLQEEEDSSSEAPSYPGGMSDASIGSEKPQAELAPSQISLPQLSRSLSSRPLLKHSHEGAPDARQVLTDLGAGTPDILMLVAPGVPCKFML